MAPNQDVLEAGNNTEVKGTSHGLGGFAKAHPIWLTTIIVVAVGGSIGIAKGLSGGSSSNSNGTFSWFAFGQLNKTLTPWKRAGQHSGLPAAFS